MKRLWFRIHSKKEEIEVGIEKSEDYNVIDSSKIKTEVIEVDIEKSENDSLIDSRNIKKEIVDLDFEAFASGSSLINSKSIKKRTKSYRDCDNWW